MLSLDHIVIGSLDPEKMSKTHQGQTIKGGEHENWGTYNYLAYFSNHSYIEWLGIKDEETASQSDNPLIQHLVHLLDNSKEGMFQFALKTNDMDRYVTRFKAKKIPFVGPVPGKRRKPDGRTLTWRMLFPKYDFTKETLPFLIEWDQPEEERIDKSIVNNEAITALHFGKTKIERFSAIYQLDVIAGNSIKLNNAEIYFTFDDSFEMNIE